MKHLNFMDVLGILVVWICGGSVIYIIVNSSMANNYKGASTIVIAIGLYFLTKIIILK